jgi:phosphate acyltransferase
VALKISESLAEMIGANLKLMFQSNWISKLGYLFLKPQLVQFKKKVDHSETGGAPLLGVNGVVIIAHGSSSPKAIKNAINRAHELSEKNIIEHIKQDIELNLLDVEGGKGTLWKQIKNIAFGDETPEDKEVTPDKSPPVNPEPKETS